jgi:hypothetical protein
LTQRNSNRFKSVRIPHWCLWWWQAVRHKSGGLFEKNPPTRNV